MGEKIEHKFIQAIYKRFNQVKSSYQMYHNNPYLSEYIQRFRVDMRKMRALLHFIKPLMPKDTYNEMNYALRDLGKQLSPLRDLDGLIEECTELALEQPELIDNYAEVFRFLQKERLTLVKEQSTKKAFDAFEEVLKQTEASLDELAASLASSERDLESFVEKRFDHKVRKLKKSVKQLDEKNYEEIHEVRKQAKKVRYASVGFKKVLPKKEWKQTRKKAKTIQEHLGKMTDVFIHVELLEEYKEKATSERVKEAFQIIIEYVQNK